MNHTLSVDEAQARIWAPDLFGSGFFLAASLLAFANAEHEWLSFRPRDLDWWIAAANVGGSLAFGLSALAAYVLSDGSELAPHLADAATAAGAACFLAGAVLLIPQGERQRRRG
jgi:hypothetical protein